MVAVIEDVRRDLTVLHRWFLLPSTRRAAAKRLERNMWVLVDLVEDYQEAWAAGLVPADKLVD